MTPMSDWLEDQYSVLDAGYKSDNRFPHGVHQAEREAIDDIRPDIVNSPSHYTGGDIECVDAIKSALGSEGFVAFARGNAIKYLWRMMDKHDDCATDARKAAKYIQWMIEELDDTK